MIDRREFLRMTGSAPLASEIVSVHQASASAIGEDFNGAAATRELADHQIVKNHGTPPLLTIGMGAILLIGNAVGWAREPGPQESPPKKTEASSSRPTRDDWFARPWLMKAPAFAIADGFYYVGNKHFSSHLVVGKEGMVLIDTPHKEHCYLLLESIRSLGFDPADITLILHTHFHCDHTGCTRRVKELSGAECAMGAKDVKRLNTLSTMKFTLEFWDTTLPYFEPFDVERPLQHGDIVDLGDRVIKCHHTPGHTPGTMTYTLDVTIDGEPHTAVLFGGPGLNFLKIRSMYYPGAKDDFAKTLDYLESLEADVWLGAHPFVNGTLGKYERLTKGETPNPFIDAGQRNGCRCLTAPSKIGRTTATRSTRRLGLCKRHNARSIVRRTICSPASMSRRSGTHVM